MTKEFQAMLSVLLTGLEEAGAARISLMKVAVRFADCHLKQEPFDEDEAVCMIDDAILGLAMATEEFQIFRNMLRDERPVRQQGDEAERTKRDPKEILAAIIRQMR